MSTKPHPHHPVGVSEPANHATVSPATLIELLGDDHVREMLGAIRSESKAARTLAEECEASRSTVYRRLDRLQDAGLVSEEMSYDGAGHHRRTFRLAAEHVDIELGADGFEADVTVIDTPSPTKD